MFFGEAKIRQIYFRSSLLPLIIRTVYELLRILKQFFVLTKNGWLRDFLTNFKMVSLTQNN